MNGLEQSKVSVEKNTKGSRPMGGDLSGSRSISAGDVDSSNSTCEKRREQAVRVEGSRLRSVWRDESILIKAIPETFGTNTEPTERMPSPLTSSR